MKKCFNLIILFVLTLIIFIPTKTSAYSGYEYDYVINKYDVNIIVNEDNTFDVTENITVYFNAPKHGIYRTIPLKNKVERLDGTTTTNKAQVSNVSVNEKYQTSKTGGEYKIKIGSSDYYLTGLQQYVIKYTYNIGKDPLKESDELYYNIIGTDWDTTIENISFTIQMPKDFDESKLGFSSGRYGSSDNVYVRYQVSNNTIIGSYTSVLEPGEALTVRCELPEGYFVGAGLDVNLWDYVYFIIPILFLIICAFLWYRYGRDEEVVETVEFYPPEGFNSLDVGFLYKGEADSQDVVSLLIYLANKGYIKISDVPKETKFGTLDDFKITKLKEYDGTNESEKKFLDGLFSSRTTKVSLFNLKSETSVENKTEVTKDDLYNKFYLTVYDILKKVNTLKNKCKIFEKGSLTKNKFIILMIIITYCLITMKPILEYGQLDILFFALIFPGVGFTEFFSVLLNLSPRETNLNGVPNGKGIAKIILAAFSGLFIGGLVWFMFVLPFLLENIMYLIGYIIGLIAVFGMVVVLKLMPKRNKYGNEILGKIRGFRVFLETAEKDRLEALVMENPTYFYDILPYTYVLGVSDTWIKKFSSIALAPPSWYDSRTTFNSYNFGIFMSTTMTSVQRTMDSRPRSKSSGSRSSGGGFSGGGSGGGGGGSW